MNTGPGAQQCQNIAATIDPKLSRIAERCICPICDELIKESLGKSVNKMLFTVTVAEMHGFIGDVLV